MFPCFTVLGALLSGFYNGFHPHFYKGFSDVLCGLGFQVCLRYVMLGLGFCKGLMGILRGAVIGFEMDVM